MLPSSVYFFSASIEYSFRFYLHATIGYFKNNQDVKKLVPLMLVLFSSCKKTDNLSGKIEISVKEKTSVTIKNGTNNSVNLFRWKLKEEIINIPTTIIHEYRWEDTILLQKVNSVTIPLRHFNLI